MKSTPDVPPALLEIVAAIRDAASDVDQVPSIAGGDDIMWMRKQSFLEIAKQLEGIALELAKPWPKTK